ncbi:MAG: neutral/alkaline non-lysosomal ceramidase N-terminal domain-containing protein [Candidatus Omnitrophica bacterium]|nr:neutral/alkaline non-lysosomal ceramidase N-terminal domain-containing protein [Candidatus Omnitrophota bacterium]
MKIGYHKVDITPRTNTELCGYGFYLNRKSTGIHDNLFAKAVYIGADSLKNEILFISCDLIGINREIIVRIREKIEKETKIRPQNIIISSTHTHSGPATLFLEGLGKMNKKYLDIFEKKNRRSRCTRQGAGV